MDVIHTLIDMVCTLLLLQYENNIVDICSSQFVPFSLTTLVKKVPSTLLVYSTCPLKIIGYKTHMFQQKMICQILDNIINEMNTLICDYN
jgi:hypothetical protein